MYSVPRPALDISNTLRHQHRQLSSPLFPFIPFMQITVYSQDLDITETVVVGAMPRIWDFVIFAWAQHTVESVTFNLDNSDNHYITIKLSV